MSVIQDYLFYRSLVPQVDMGHFSCDSELNVENFAPLTIKSEGVSGDVLASGKFRLGDMIISIVVKLYSVPSPFRVINHGGKTLIRPRNVVDQSRFEIGNTMALTDVILMNSRHLTPNITFALGYKICPAAYETSDQRSKCDPSIELPSNGHFVPMHGDSFYPQNAFRSNYEYGTLSEAFRESAFFKSYGSIYGCGARRWRY